MAWIESHQNLREHPKVIALCGAMGWELDVTIGKLHRFWWWCLDYAPDGDLRKFNDFQIAFAAGVAAADAKRFVEAMVSGGGNVVSGFIDREPYFRVHDWWDYAGRFLQVRWKHNKEKWETVRSAYRGSSDSQGNPPLKQPPEEPPIEPQTNQPTNQPHPPARACARRLHGIPSSADEVVAYGKSCLPKPVSEERCRAFWSHYEGQARTNPNGDTFWITSGEVVVTNWREKLQTFGLHQKGANANHNNGAGNRNTGTANAGKTSGYSAAASARLTKGISNPG